MDYCFAFSWPYIGDSDAEKNAQDMFAKLQQHRDEFPFSVSHEVGLVRSPSGNWFVAVLTLMGGTGDDSVRIFEGLKGWLEKSEAPGYQDYESVPVSGSSIQASLPEYDVVDSFS